MGREHFYQTRIFTNVRNMKKDHLSILLIGFLLSACTSNQINPTNEPLVLPEIQATQLPEPAVDEDMSPQEEKQYPKPLVVEKMGLDEPPVIDGTLDSGEWDNAIRTHLSDGSDIFWLYSDGYLYVGVNSDRIGAANLALIREDDQVWILHSSAALGSAIYEQQTENWNLIQDFSWCCRSASVFTEREQLFQEEGWQANIGYQGTEGQVEYQVAVERGEIQIALMYLYADGSDGFSYWPDHLSDEAVGQLQGRREKTEYFSLGEWMTVLLVERDS